MIRRWSSSKGGSLHGGARESGLMVICEEGPTIGAEELVEGTCGSESSNITNSVDGNGHSSKTSKEGGMM